MDSNFAQAAEGLPYKKPRLVFTSDCVGTLYNTGGVQNMTLLQLLSDAATAGHRVIITSKSDARMIADNIFLMAIRANKSGFSVDTTGFEYVTKSDLRFLKDEDGQPIQVDYAFDDEKITYIEPAVTVRIGADMTPSFPFQAIRSLSELPAAARSGGSGPRPAV